MSEKMKWGLFCKNKLLAEFPLTTQGFENALENAKVASERTGESFEVKRYVLNDVIIRIGSGKQ
jgi:hypothetical protein